MNYNFFVAEKYFCLTFYNNKQMIMLVGVLLCRTAALQVDISYCAVDNLSHFAKKFLRLKVNMLRGNHKSVSHFRFFFHK